MKKRILRMSEAALTTLCALGFFVGFMGLGISISPLWFIPIVLIIVGLFLVVILLEDQVEYEGMSIDERHEMLVGRGYKYCPYCGEKLKNGDSDER